ncbi:MAG TPA: response regulator, partial [Planctomycetaceae bacterium]|nr:response regulator [Planctomycetaceae bacterium]
MEEARRSKGICRHSGRRVGDARLATANCRGRLAATLHKLNAVVPIRVMRHSLSILLVDDEEIVHETLGEFLRDLGHHVHHAYDGRAGLEQIESREYDIALLDVRMPGIDGLTLLSRIHTIRPAMPCVIITGHADLESAVRALRLGAMDFWVKPVDMLYLEAMLERVETVRGLQRERRHLR